MQHIFLPGKFLRKELVAPIHSSYTDLRDYTK